MNLLRIYKLKPLNYICIYLRNYSLTNKPKLTIKECCDILELSDSEINLTQLKYAYISCCKRHHPDVSNNDDEKFLQIEDAYRTLKDHIEYKEMKKEIKLEINDDDDGDDDKLRKHKVPQHRQYLSYDGVGYGPPSSRLKQYEKYRLNSATDAVYEFKVEKVKSQSTINDEKGLVMKDVHLQRQIKTKQGFDRLVEDLIQEAMAKGDFENLPGKGKPLKHRPELPYIDSTTYKLNQILINNGFVPEWVRLEKEITEEKNHIKELIVSALCDDQMEDDKLLSDIEIKVKNLNFKIDKYNSLVPIFNKQQIHFILKKEITKLQSNMVTNTGQLKKNNNHQKANSNNNSDKTFLDIISSIFRI